MSGIFQHIMYHLEIKQYNSSAYHPQSLGTLERFDQTPKNMMRAYCFEQERDRNEAVHSLLYLLPDKQYKTRWDLTHLNCCLGEKCMDHLNFSKKTG